MRFKTKKVAMFASWFAMLVSINIFYIYKYKFILKYLNIERERERDARFDKKIDSFLLIDLFYFILLI